MTYISKSNNTTSSNSQNKIKVNFPPLNNSHFINPAIEVQKTLINSNENIQKLAEATSKQIALLPPRDNLLKLADIVAQPIITLPKFDTNMQNFITSVNNQITSSLPDYHEMFNQLLKVINNQTINSFPPNFTNNIESLSHIVEIASTIGFEDNFEIDRQQIENDVYQSYLDNDTNLEDKVDLLTYEIKDLSDKVEKNQQENRKIDYKSQIKISLFLFIMSFLISPWVTPFISHYQDTYNENVQQIQHHIIKNSSSFVDNFVTQENKNNYRIITKDSLPIRTSNSRNSSIIGYLNVGDIVKISNKKRNWIKVQTNEIEGWTYTRYTKQIKKDSN